MQCRECSIMPDLSDKYYTVFEYPKKIFHIPKWNCSWKTDKLQSYRVFLYAKWSILTANIKNSLYKILQEAEPAIGRLFENRYSERFCNIHRKTPVLKSLFNNVAGLKVHSFIRKRLHHMCFLVKNIAKFFKTAFKEHLFWNFELLNSSIFFI